MSLTGTHAAGDAGHVADHNLVDAKLSTHDAQIAALQAGGGGGGGSAVSSVNTRTGAVTLAKADVGLGSVDNTADTAKPVSTATQTALNAKANLTGNTFTGTQDFSGATVTGIGGTSVVLLNAGATVPGGTPVGSIIFQKLA